MKAETQIFERYRLRGVVLGMELLLRHADAIRFIQDCKQLRLTILGTDFYKQWGSDVIELPGCSADFSSISGKRDAIERSVTAAWDLIKDRLPEDATWVSFIIEE